MAQETTEVRTRAAHLGPERRRPAVLDAALEVALSQGVAAVTIGSVADQLEVTRPVVYSCFKDRVQLVEALVDRECETLIETGLTALHATGVGREPEDAFVVGFQALLETVAERPGAWQLIFQGSPDQWVAERFAEARTTITRAATDWIRPMLERTSEMSDLPGKLPILMELFMGACEGAVRRLLDPANTWTPRELGEFVGRAAHRMFSDA